MGQQTPHTQHGRAGVLLQKMDGIEHLSKLGNDAAQLSELGVDLWTVSYNS